MSDLPDTVSTLSVPELVTAQVERPRAQGKGASIKRNIRRMLWLLGTLVVVLSSGFGVQMALKKSAAAHEVRRSGAGVNQLADPGHAAIIPVNTVRPRKKTLERTLIQPGSIKPWAQAELYAKTSGYLKSLRRAITPRMAADLVAWEMTFTSAPMARSASLVTNLAWQLDQAPRIDLGESVKAGDFLLEIATPERTQEIVEKETIVKQREAELLAAATSLTTFEAAIEASRAVQVQADADVRRHASEHTFRTQELNRFKELALSRTVTQEIADEKQNQVNAAQAAWESSLAKVKSAQADLAVVSSKLTAARADLKVKEVLVQVALDQLQTAKVLAGYSLLRAPFDGIVTFRGVDEGDFVQNATSGQSRLLMTVTSMDKVKVVLQVPEKDAPWIQAGTTATVFVDARSSWQAKGRVDRIPYSLETQTRTMPVEIDIENRERQILPGMYGRVSLILQSIPNAQAIPATAIYSRKGENFILIVKNGLAHRQLVRVRYDDGKEVEVVKIEGGGESPLDGTEEVIVSNKGEISEGQHVRPTSLPLD